MFKPWAASSFFSSQHGEGFFSWRSRSPRFRAIMVLGQAVLSAEMLSAVWTFERHVCFNVAGDALHHCAPSRESIACTLIYNPRLILATGRL